MKKYQKIETLYRFDERSKQFVDGDFTNPIVKYLANCGWYGSEKIDGTNIRVLWTGYKFVIAGRESEDIANVPKEVLQLFEKTFTADVEVVVEQTFGEKEVIFFMEAYAGKIQRGIYTGDEKFIGFDICVNDSYINRETAKEVFSKIGIQFVPVREFCTIYDAIEYVKSNPLSEIDATAHIEGLVCLPKERIYDNQGNRIAVKIKVRDLRKTNIKDN